MNVVGVIMARGGSIGVPRKNTLLLAERPILSYTIDSALEAVSIDRVVVSTEDCEIAEIAVACGAEVPFMRPSYLAEGHFSYPPVMAHAVKELEKLECYKTDIIVFLNPMFIYRPVGLIDFVVEVLLGSLKYDTSVVAGMTVTNIWEIDGDGFNCLTSHTEDGCRQYVKPVYIEKYGLVSAYRSEVALAERFYGDSVHVYGIEDSRALVDIDTPSDFVISNLLELNSDLILDASMGRELNV